MKKTPSSGKSLISTYSIFWRWGGGGRLFELEWEWEGGGGGRFFEVVRLTFSAFRMDVYSRWGAYLNKYGMTTVMTHTAFNCFYAF